MALTKITGEGVGAVDSLGIGTAVPSQSLHVVGEGLFEKASADSVVSVSSTGGSGRSYQIRSQTSGDFYIYDNTAGAARVTIDSNGSVLSGTTNDVIWNVASGEGIVLYQGKAFQVARNNDSCVQLNRQGSDGSIQLFARGGTQVGRIDVTASSTSYVTSSDYRLKENVDYTWDATTRLKQLKPARFNFIADADITVDGFLAHEVQDVVPEAISGTKDAMRDEEYEVTPSVLDEDGNVVTEAVMGTRSVPDYQGIDQGKLVPLLVKTIQELEARIAALETA